MDLTSIICSSVNLIVLRHILKTRRLVMTMVAYELFLRVNIYSITTVLQLFFVQKIDIRVNGN